MGVGLCTKMLFAPLLDMNSNVAIVFLNKQC